MAESAVHREHLGCLSLVKTQGWEVQRRLVEAAEVLRFHLALPTHPLPVAQVVVVVCTEMVARARSVPPELLDRDLMVAMVP